jgi:hypothetical protein
MSDGDGSITQSAMPRACASHEQAAQGEASSDSVNSFLRCFAVWLFRLRSLAHLIVLDSAPSITRMCEQAATPALADS